jgi:hypothetical protein
MLAEEFERLYIKEAVLCAYDHLDGDIRVDEDGQPMVIYEMANFLKEISGLPVNVWIDESQSYKSSNHPDSPRIKPQNNYDGNFQPNDLFSITIPVNPDNEPEVMPSNTKVKISDSDVNILKDFVKKYRGELLNVADKKMAYYNFVKKYRKKEGLEK